MQPLPEKHRTRMTWQLVKNLLPWWWDKVQHNMLSNKLKSLLKIQKKESFKNYPQNGSLKHKTKTILQIKEITTSLCCPRRQTTQLLICNSILTINYLIATYVPRNGHWVTPFSITNDSIYKIYLTWWQMWNN